MSKEKQNQDLINTLITVAESSSKTSVVPASKSKKETVKEVVYRVLKENPYKFKQYDLFYEVHINQLKKSRELKLEKYKLQRSELCSLLGWGIHGDQEGKLALVAVESSEYMELLNNPNINKKKAYNK
ncbi:DUF6157 family protein [Polaribacter marinivivus]|uniref:DUF6157 family protein n=1 Tax=Polaribacter marinivivus TaxID=1524260 RepID=UPI003D329058